MLPLTPMLDLENELQQANACVDKLTRALEKARCRLIAAGVGWSESDELSDAESEAIELSHEDQSNMAEIDDELYKEAAVPISSLAKPGFGPSSASIEEMEDAYEDCMSQEIQNDCSVALRKVLAEDCAEYKEVESAFMLTLTNHHAVHAIERIQNSRLWDVYEAYKNTMVNDPTFIPEWRPHWWRLPPARHRRVAHDVERKWLFHATDESTVEEIVKGNFDRSFAGKHSASYGQGCYFARDASYSAKVRLGGETYSIPNKDGFKFVILCRVLW